MPIRVYDFGNGNFGIPFALGAGKVITSGKTVFNLFAEPRCSVADRGAGQPKWQICFALNLRFMD